jgi:VWFA-related protein
MTRLLIGVVIAVIIITVGGQIGGAQSYDLSTQSAPSNAAIIPKGKIMAIQLDTPLNTCFTKKGENVEFHTTADVVVDSTVLIPNHSLVRCQVIKSKGSRIMGRRAEIQLRLINVRLPDGTILPLEGAIIRAGTDAVRDSTLTGEVGKGVGSTQVMNGAMQGGLIGMFSGSWKAAMVGTAAGALFPTIGAISHRGSELDFPANTMFEARFEKPLEIPPQSVLAQNTPAPGSNTQTDAVTANTLVAEATVSTGIGPVFNPSQMEHPIEITSISKPEPDNVLLSANMSTEEAMKKGPSVLNRTENTTATEGATISKSGPSPIASPIMPRDETRSAEPAGKGFNIKVNVKMVQLDAVVRGHSGNSMPSLGAEDFKIYDNQVLQKLAGFSLDKKPLAVAIVVDHSGSVTPYISQLRSIASRALSNLKEQDEVCLFAFDQNVQLIEGLTADRQRIAFAIERISGGESTNILDALYTAASYLVKKAPNRRHAIILVSDNQQTVLSKSDEQDVIKLAQEKDVVVYSLKTGASFSPVVLSSGNPLQSIVAFGNSLQSILPLGNPQLSMISGDPVSKVANDSGGEVICVTSIESLDGAINAVISRLRTSYSLGYYPSDSQSGTFHAIAVRLADKFGKSGSDYSIQAKKGYYAVQSADR